MIKKETIKDLNVIIEKLINDDNWVQITSFIKEHNYSYKYYRYLFDILIHTNHNDLPIVNKSIDNEYIIKPTHNLKNFQESGGFKSLSKSKIKHNRFEKVKSIAPIIISCISVIAAIAFGILSINLDNRIDYLEREIIKKDSIIIELKK
jgi:hypothetical protein